MNRFIKHTDKKGSYLKQRVASKNREISKKDGSDGELELPEIRQGHGLERAESSKLSLHANKNGFIKQLKLNKYGGLKKNEVAN